MANFDYKQAFTHVNIDITKEMIAYKGKTIPAHDVIGIGLGFTDMAKVAAGQVLGGIVGGVIAQKGYNMGGTLNKKISELPKSRFAQMIITFNKDGKQDFIRVPLNTNDETCVNMIHAIAKEYSNNFIGFGGLATVQKELKISQLWIVFLVVAIILVITAVTIIGANSNQY